MSEIGDKQDLVTVGKIIENSSGGNTLFLELGQQKQKNHIFNDYARTRLTNKEGSKSPRVEINKKKKHILQVHQEKCESQNLLSQVTFKENDPSKRIEINSAEYGCVPTMTREDDTSFSHEVVSSQKQRAKNKSLVQYSPELPKSG